MKLHKKLAIAALIALLPLSGIALSRHNQHPIPDRPPGHPAHKTEQTHKTAAHPHTAFGKHDGGHGKAFGKTTKEHFAAAKASRKS